MNHVCEVSKMALVSFGGASGQLADQLCIYDVIDEMLHVGTDLHMT